MPLEILLVLVVAGIAGIGAALHLLGLSRAAALSEDVVRQAWVRHFPEDTVQTVHVATSGQAALVNTDHGRGLLWRFGADTVARRLPCQGLERHGKGLRLYFADFTAPSVDVMLTPSEQALWERDATQP